MNVPQKVSNIKMYVSQDRILIKITLVSKLIWTQQHGMQLHRKRCLITVHMLEVQNMKTSTKK